MDRWNTLATIMRIRIPLGRTPAIHPTALRGQATFLYRRIADRDHEVVGVGEVNSGPEPVFAADGRAWDWTFGRLGYDAWEEIHERWGRHGQNGPFSASHWFVPRWVIERQGEEGFLHVLAGDEEPGQAFAERLFRQVAPASPQRSLQWHGRTSRQQYIAAAEQFLRHIHRGDIYEVNYCIERTANDPEFDPFTAFAELQKGTEAPFSAFYHHEEQFVLCASPERFLHFEGTRVTAEPMKGTRPRGRSMAEDDQLQRELATNEKERSENIMAVDVMRNDLSRTAAPGSVRVLELCGVRSYPRVHQLVSTIVSERKATVSPWEVVRAAFPMASMTGAPKLRAMELIDAAEERPRGLYSGTLGFFAPDGTGDLNVVIRTILFNSSTGNLSLTTGSALTALCDPEQEWEECAVKARSVLHAIGHVG